MTSIKIINPTVVKVVKDSDTEKPSYEAVVLEGAFRKVFPETPREVFAITLLTPGERYAFAAGCGEGICIAEKAFQRLQKMDLT